MSVITHLIFLFTYLRCSISSFRFKGCLNISVSKTLSTKPYTQTGDATLSKWCCWQYPADSGARSGSGCP